MFLAHCYNVDEIALICDLAESYQVYGLRDKPIGLIAMLAVGLRDSSRIKLKLSNMRVDLDRQLTASILDKLAFISWTKTKDAQNGYNRPRSILAMLLGNDSTEKDVSFDSPEDFMKEWERLNHSEE